MDLQRMSAIEAQSTQLRKPGSLRNLTDEALKSKLNERTTNFDNMLTELKGMYDSALNSDEERTVAVKISKVSNDKVTVVKKIIGELNSRNSISPKYCVKVKSTDVHWFSKEKQICASNVDTKLFISPYDLVSLSKSL